MLRSGLCFGLALFVGAVAHADEKPDFTGTWVLDLARSELQIRAPDSSVFEISHNEPDWRVVRTHVYGGRANELVMELSTDGSPTISKNGRTSTESTLLWDEYSLILRWRESRGGKLRGDGEVRYSLTEDGQTFVAEEKMNSARSTHHNLWVFSRKNGG